MSALKKVQAEVIEEFAEESSIHGVRFVFCDRHWRKRAFCSAWALTVIVCTAATFWYGGSSIFEYYQFRVKTTTSMEEATGLDFPALTFANENRLRKSAVSGSKIALQGLVATVANHPDEIHELFKLTLEVCYDPTRNDSLTHQLNRGYPFFIERGFVAVASMICPDSFTDVRRCWWQDRAINCSQLFLNHMCDNGWCFTFNPHRDIIKQNSLGTKHREATGYGVDLDYNNFPLIAAGPRSGLRLLMNVNHDDYCVTRRPIAGYKVIVHNGQIQPMFFLENPLLLTPGFETRVAIRLSKFARKTEKIGRCVNFQHLYLQPEATVYFREACYLQCITDAILRGCSCFPLHAPSGANKQVFNQLLNGSMKFCWGVDELLCQQRYERQFIEKGFGSFCDDECARPCDEIKYTTQTTLALFPPAHLGDVYAREYGFPSVEKFRENYLSVEFYVESLLMPTVEEVQAMEIIDLISSLGGIVGFYLGMSVMSLLEVVQILLFLAFPTLAQIPPAETTKPVAGRGERLNTRRKALVDGRPASVIPKSLRVLDNHYTPTDHEGKRWYFGNYVHGYF